MPVIFNEPLSFLQRIVEYMEYATLLSKASMCDDPVQRLEVSRNRARDKKIEVYRAWHRIIPGLYIGKLQLLSDRCVRNICPSKVLRIGHF